jgi:hypothetical protein
VSQIFYVSSEVLMTLISYLGITVPDSLKSRICLGGAQNEVLGQHGETHILVSQQPEDSISCRPWLQCQIAHMVEDLYTLAHLMYHVMFLAFQAFPF